MAQDKMVWHDTYIKKRRKSWKDIEMERSGKEEQI
jgi:hypothetical protein